MNNDKIIKDLDFKFNLGNEDEIIKSNSKSSGSRITKICDTNYQDLVTRNTKICDIELPKFGNSLKEINKETNNIYNIHTHTITIHKDNNEQIIRKGLEVVNGFDINIFNVADMSDVKSILSTFERVLKSKQQYFKINKENIDILDIKEKITELTYNDDVIKNKQGKIKDPVKYIISVFWNNDTHSSIYYQNRINADMMNSSKNDYIIDDFN